MRNKPFLLFLLLILFTGTMIQAQNKVTRAADQAFADQLFLQALQKYQKAYSKVKNNKAERDRISFRIAECYRYMNNTKRAETSYKRLVNNAKYVKDDPKVLLLYANMLKTNGNYDEAIKQYQAYKERVPGDTISEAAIEACKIAREWMNNPSKYDVRWEKMLNTKDDEFAAAYADKKFISIIFTSDRGGAKGRDIDNWTGLGFSDFFFSRIDKKGDWSKPIPADDAGMINSKANDGVGQFNARFSSFYFTRCWNNPEKRNGCGIFKTTRQGGTTWSEPEMIDFGADSTKVLGHPTVASDETIYFSADLPGGYGGKDIWMAKKDKKGGRYMKQNMGPEINTAGDELFPFIRNDSILYFASNGHPGMGGLDIFVTTYSKTGSSSYQWKSTGKPSSAISGATSAMYKPLADSTTAASPQSGADSTTAGLQWQGTGEQPLSLISGATSGAYQPAQPAAKPGWTKPENMRYPINSHADDFAIVFNGDESEQGLFSSSRPGGKGRDDIYSFVIPPVYFTLEGTITDDRTLQPIPGAKVRIVGTNGRIIEDNTDDKGNYGFNKMQIAPNTTYDILVTKKDYFNEKGRETTVGLEKSKDLVRNFVLRPIPKKPVVLPDILYDLAKWDLKPQYQDSLIGLIETLDANETIVIELASHTDSRDSDERNDILSQKRAQSVVDYLISRGIDPDRLVARGYGERVPRTLARDITREGYTFPAGTTLTDSVINLLPSNNIKEAAHQLNRRSEFTILRNDFVPKTKVTKPTATKIEVVVKPEENNVPFKKNKDGIIEATCYLSGITTPFTFDPKEKSVYISPVLTLKLLKDGVIDKSNFDGDPTKILGEGTVADKAVLTLKEVRIGKNTVKDVKATVNKKTASFHFGDSLLKQFGQYSIDEGSSEFIFE